MDENVGRLFKMGSVVDFLASVRAEHDAFSGLGMPPRLELLNQLVAKLFVLRTRLDGTFWLSTLEVDP